MHFSMIVSELQKAIGVRLFVDSRWSANVTQVTAIQKLLERLGLEAELPDQPGTWRISELGQQLNCGLMEAFLGILDEWDVIIELLTHELIDEIEAGELEH